MEKLIKILREFEVEEHEVAEMMWAYLVAFGDEDGSDVGLINELDDRFFKRGE